MLFIDIAKYFINYFAHFRKTRAHEERIDQGDRSMIARAERLTRPVPQIPLLSSPLSQQSYFVTHIVSQFNVRFVTNWASIH